jgi:hypothetical protein
LDALSRELDRRTEAGVQRQTDYETFIKPGYVGETLCMEFHPTHGKLWREMWMRVRDDL